VRRRRIGALAAVAALAAGGVALGVHIAGGSTPAHRSPTTAATRSAAPTPPARPVRAASAFVPLSAPSAPARASVRVPVLMFHRVASPATATDAVARDLTVPPATFAAELAWLHRHGYHPIHLAALFQALERGAPLPRRPVVLTFDDGYVDAVTTILPLLHRYGWPATFFVITGRAGERAFLTWPQIVRLDRAGMDVGSHTVDHVELPGLSASEREREIVDSRRALRRHLGHSEYWFAYPAGRYDGSSEAALSAAGYLLAFTTDPGSTISAATPMAEPRVRIHGQGTLADFAAAVASASG
jgi:peptidoglycan/xylan/chitin deacetylase (PgdA/CDA1 family)